MYKPLISTGFCDNQCLSVNCEDEMTNVQMRLGGSQLARRDLHERNVNGCQLSSQIKPVEGIGGKGGVGGATES